MTAATQPPPQPPTAEPEERDPAACLKQAEGKFRSALTLSPDNLAIVTRLGAIRERQDDYVGAMRTYLQFADKWGDRVFEIRFRLAADLGMSDAWLAQLAAPGFDRDEFASALEKCVRGSRKRRAGHGAGLSSSQRLIGAVSKPRAEHLHAQLLEAAATEWNALGRFVGLPRSLWRCVGTVRPSLRYNDGAYQVRFIGFGRELRERKQRVRLAGLATEVQRLAPWPLPLASGVRRLAWLDIRSRRGLKRRHTAPAVEYARVCVLARIYEITGDRAHAREALDSLREIMQTGSTETWVTTIGNDPDLASIRRTERFRQWCDQLKKSETSPFAWICELCEELERRWRLYEDLVSEEPDEQLAEFAVRCDDDCLTYLASAGAPSLPRATRRRLLSNLAARAADLHVRIEAPSVTTDFERALQPRDVEGFGDSSVEQLLDGLRGADTSSPGARADLWKLVRERVQMFDAAPVAD